MDDVRKTGLSITQQQFDWLERRRTERDAQLERSVGRSEIGREVLALGMAVWDELERADWDFEDDDVRARSAWGREAAQTLRRIEAGECDLVCE